MAMQMEFKPQIKSTAECAERSEACLDLSECVVQTTMERIPQFNHLKRLIFRKRPVGFI